MRFYHAKIDAGNLIAGEDYSSLRNVAVIFITTYDPFGLERMIYTIKNSCVEEPNLFYEDGARTIFLYTGGTEGAPSEELLQLARYMEHSTPENACTADLARLHEMVTEVKSDREVGLKYMKSCEIEKRIRDEGRAEAIIDTCYEFGLSENEILNRLQKKLNLPLETAQKYLARFGKQVL